MPLVQGSSKEAINKNIETEREAGKPQNQAIAIAMETARKAKAQRDAADTMNPLLPGARGCK